MVTRRALIALLAALGCAGTLLAADSRQEWSQPTKKWMNGPVRCLATVEEEKQFKELKSDEERTRFIKDFWQRRDPTPGTPENEFAEHFWKRAGEADTRFVQTTESGARSDRGQIYILFGLPNRVASGKNLEWIYENVPSVTPASFTVLFRAVGSGNLLLLAKKEVDEVVAKNEFVRGLGPKVKEIYAPAPAVTAEALPPAAETTPPPAAAPTEEQKILDATAGVDLLPSDIPLQVRTDVYEATKGDSFVAVTLGTPKGSTPGAGLVGFARFIPEAPGTQAVTVASPGSFAPAGAENDDPSNRLLLFQGGAGLHPGRYTLVAGLRDPGTGKAGIQRLPVEAPAFAAGGLALSTVALVRKLERLPAPPETGGGKKTPFVLGTFRIVPSLDSLFSQGSELAWYFQIYNAAPDPLTGSTNLTIQYEFLLKQKGEYRPVAPPQIFRNRSNQVEAFAFPLVKPTEKQKGWVPGEYKLMIKVTDEVSKTSVSREVPFTVTE